MPDKAILALETGKVFKFEKNGKYLVILPAHAKFNELGIAIEKFFSPTPVLVIGAQDVNAIKIAELLEEKIRKGGKKNAR